MLERKETQERKVAERTAQQRDEVKRKARAHARQTRQAGQRAREQRAHIEERERARALMLREAFEQEHNSGQLPAERMALARYKGKVAAKHAQNVRYLCFCLT
jgi:hypothetical protein